MVARALREAFYATHNPGKIPGIPRALASFEGHEAEMMTTLHNKVRVEVVTRW